MSRSATELEEPPARAVYDDEDADAWLAAAPRSRMRRFLVTLLAASLVFLAGVQVQKHLGASGATGAGGISAGAFTGAPAFGSGGPGGTTGTAPGTGGVPTTEGSASARPGASSSAVTEVIGRLVTKQGRHWTLTDLGGTTHRVVVTEATRFTVKGHHSEPSAVRRGQTLQVRGTTADGTLSATRVTVR